MTTARPIQPHTLVLDADARDRALACTAVRIEVGWPGGPQTLWGSHTYLAALVAGERSVAGTGLPRRYAPRYRELVTAWLAAVAAGGVPYEIYTARRRKQVLVFGARDGRRGTDIQRLIDADARPASQWCALWASSPRWRTRQLVARSSHTPDDVRVLLAHDRSALVRRAVAGCPATSPALLRHLAADPHPRVRGALLWRDDLPADIVTILLADPEAYVRGLAIHHPACPDDYRMLAQVASSDTRWQQHIIRFPGWWTHRSTP